MMKYFLFLLLVFACVPDAPADHHEGINEGVQKSLQNSLQNSLTRQNRLPVPRPDIISNQRAASLVKEHHSGSRVLGVSLLDEQGPPVYKVRTLSPQGVVRSIFVDGNSGEVFE